MASHWIGSSPRAGRSSPSFLPGEVPGPSSARVTYVLILLSRLVKWGIEMTRGRQTLGDAVLESRGLNLGPLTMPACLQRRSDPTVGSKASESRTTIVHV